MKKGFLYITILLLPTFLFAQMKNDWGAFNQRATLKILQERNLNCKLLLKFNHLTQLLKLKIRVRVEGQIENWFFLQYDG